MVTIGQDFTAIENDRSGQITPLQPFSLVELSDDARRQGVYIIGTTGTGKTTLLKNIVLQDMESGAGVCVLDPHGDMINDLLALVPPTRADDVILFAPGEPKQEAAEEGQYDRPLGLNVFSCDTTNEREKELVASTVLGTLKKLFFYSWGPRMEELLRMSILTLLEKPNSTMLDLWLLLATKLYQYKAAAQVQDKVLSTFWNYQFLGHSERERLEIAASSLNKVSRFLTNRMIRNIVGQPTNAFDLKQVMDEGKILFCNLSKGQMGEDNSALFGAVLINLIQVATLSRINQPREQRRPFHLIVDEYQSFATESFPILQTEARKFGITITVAHQYRDQLDDLNKGSTLNVANFICLRVTGKDSYELASQFDNSPAEPDTQMQPLYRETRERQGEQLYAEARSPVGTGREFREVKLPRRMYSDVAQERANLLSTLPDLEALARIVEKGQLTEYRIGITQPQPHTKVSEAQRKKIAQRIRQNSLKLGKKREEIEPEIDRIIDEVRKITSELPPERAEQVPPQPAEPEPPPPTEDSTTPPER